MRGGVRYFSREGAAAAADPSVAPKLQLNYQAWSRRDRCAA